MIRAAPTVHAGLRDAVVRSPVLRLVDDPRQDAPVPSDNSDRPPRSQPTDCSSRLSTTSGLRPCLRSAAWRRSRERGRSRGRLSPSGRAATGQPVPRGSWVRLRAGDSRGLRASRTPGSRREPRLRTLVHRLWRTTDSSPPGPARSAPCSSGSRAHRRSDPPGESCNTACGRPDRYPAGRSSSRCCQACRGRGCRRFRSGPGTLRGNPEIAEADLNPVACTTHGCVVLDTRLRIQPFAKASASRSGSARRWQLSAAPGLLQLFGRAFGPRYPRLFELSADSGKLGLKERGPVSPRTRGVGRSQSPWHGPAAIPWVEPRTPPRRTTPPAVRMTGQLKPPACRLGNRGNVMVGFELSGIPRAVCGLSR